MKSIMIAYKNKEHKQQEWKSGCRFPWDSLYVYDNSVTCQAAFAPSLRFKQLRFQADHSTYLYSIVIVHFHYFLLYTVYM